MADTGEATDDHEKTPASPIREQLRTVELITSAHDCLNGDHHA
jgi:hypothetical protein